MRHSKYRIQLNRFTSWRKATIGSLARSLILHQRIKTSLHKAKAVKPLIERLIVLSKEGTVTARREAFKVLGDHKIVSMLFKDLAPMFTKSGTGFSRIIHLGSRRGDNAKMVIIELTEAKKKVTHKKEKKEKLPKEEDVSKINVDTKPAIEPKPEREESAPQAPKDKPVDSHKPTKKFLGGLRKIFKKERDSL